MLGPEQSSGGGRLRAVVNRDTVGEPAATADRMTEATRRGWDDSERGDNHHS